jgi:hypothetical protein
VVVLLLLLLLLLLGRQRHGRRERQPAVWCRHMLVQGAVATWERRQPGAVQVLIG